MAAHRSTLDEAQKITLSAVDLAQAIGLDKRRIQAMAQDGTIPRPEKAGSYALVACWRGYTDLLRSGATSADADRVKLDKEREQLEALRLKNAQTRGELATRQEFAQEWCRFVAACRSQLLSLPGMLRMHTNLDREGEEMARRIVDDALAELGRDPDPEENGEGDEGGVVGSAEALLPAVADEAERVG